MQPFWIIATVAAIALAAVFWPRHGLLARWQRSRRRRGVRRAEDALKHLHACEWRGDQATPASVAGALHLSQADATHLIAHLETQGWLTTSGETLRLTPAGEQLALSVIRAHRLWERFLADEARMPLTAIHAEAERREHDRSDAMLASLEAALGHPVTDPHGDPIPTAGGKLARRHSKALTDWPLNVAGQIVHLEDEPAVVYSQLIADGFHPGQTLRVLAGDHARLLLSDGEHTYTLAPIIAANIFVVPSPVAAPAPTLPTLAGLRVGQQATVRHFADELQGFSRRRLLDLGLTPGTNVTAAMRSLLGDPVAYRVRGTLIALRHEQAQQIYVEMTNESERQ